MFIEPSHYCHNNIYIIQIIMGYWIINMHIVDSWAIFPIKCGIMHKAAIIICNQCLLILIAALFYFVLWTH